MSMMINNPSGVTRGRSVRCIFFIPLINSLWLWLLKFLGFILGGRVGTEKGELLIWKPWSKVVVVTGMLGFFTMESITNGDQYFVNSVTLFVALLCACIVIGHLLEENRWINDSITALLIVRSVYQSTWETGFDLMNDSKTLFWLQGLFSGIIILLTTKGKSSRLLEFDEQLFFIYLLPPIIFNAG